MYDVPTTGSMGPYYCFVSPTTFIKTHESTLLYSIPAGSIVAMTAYVTAVLVLCVVSSSSSCWFVRIVPGDRSSVVRLFLPIA